MLFYTFFYLVSALLLVQGTHLAGEQRHPMGAVPAELALPSGAARAWGKLLVLMGLIGLACGLASHGDAPRISRQTLAFVEGVEWVLMGVYGLWLVFIAKRIEYIGVAAASADHGHH
ncbi:hypothetical protein [Holophaga foetida]|uniref:hypothetical protein n=1 Tax=Holophaga foetida TaxID=35839 RepID=UPI00024749CD|nr:hypothetical protein [Holophaga foetida]